jgi:hypothetical protein
MDHCESFGLSSLYASQDAEYSIELFDPEVG